MSRPPGVLCSSSSPRFTLTLALVVSTVAEVAATVTVSCTLGHLQREVDRRGLTDLHGHAFAHHALESGDFDLHGIDAGRQRREAPLAAVIGSGGHLTCNQRGTGDDNGYAGQHGALFIRDLDENTSGLNLRAAAPPDRAAKTSVARVMSVVTAPQGRERPDMGITSCEHPDKYVTQLSRSYSRAHKSRRPPAASDRPDLEAGGSPPPRRDPRWGSVVTGGALLAL